MEFRLGENVEMIEEGNILSFPDSLLCKECFTIKRSKEFYKSKSKYKTCKICSKKKKEKKEREEIIKEINFLFHNLDENDSLSLESLESLNLKDLKDLKKEALKRVTLKRTLAFENK